jgi:sialic acid-specific 9-O-acetylesterase
MTSALTLATPFTDHLVLQQGRSVRVWGRASPGADIEVSLLAGQGATEQVLAGAVGRSDAAGRWETVLEPQEAARGLRLWVSDGEMSVLCEDVAVGEVWVAGGQSNMEYLLGFDAEYEALSALAPDPDVRFLDVAKTCYPGQLEEHDYSAFSHWRTATYEDLPWFSAVPYFLATRLSRRLGVPVGVIGCTWGGTPGTTWCPAQSLRGTGAQVWLTEYEQAAARTTPHAHLAAARRSRMIDLSRPFADPRFVRMMYPGYSRLAQRLITPTFRYLTPLPLGPAHPGRPGGLFETMVSQVAGYTARGLLWYQGESDWPHPQAYADVMGAVVSSWRQAWGEDLPFLAVELAPLQEWLGTSGDAFPLIRAAQAQVADTVPGVWLATNGDGGMRWDIHPKRKRPVAERLTLLALRHVYDQDVDADAPVARRAVRRGRQVVIEIDHGQRLVVDAGRGEWGPVVSYGCGGYGPVDGAGRSGRRLMADAGRIGEPVADADRVGGLGRQVAGVLAGRWPAAGRWVTAGREDSSQVDEGPGVVELTVYPPSGVPRLRARGHVEGDRLVLRAPVPVGSQIRYAWSGWFTTVVRNGAGLPMRPFCLVVQE